jgi:Flp pilus assembly protein TadD
MTKPIRFASAISLVALASAIASCASPQSRVSSGFGGPAKGEVGLATRALAALNSNDYATAISFAERAVEKTPDDAGFRALLGNAYFAGGRFASAEAAFKDSLSIYSNQPQVVLKLALVEIAQGKNDEAANFLAAGSNVLDPADYGLALALAGRPADAIAVLNPAARQTGADARVRQNLALAYAFAGDWTQARTIAGQDVPADKLDARMHQWMQMAKPVHASDQVAALTGVTPAASDPGQPVRLALHKTDSRLAAVTPPAALAPQAVVAPLAPLQAAVEPAPAAPPPVAQVYEPAPVRVAHAAIAPKAPAAVASFTPSIAPAPPPARQTAQVRRASARPAARNAVFRRGNSQAVVQLGAYANPQRVATAWAAAAKRYAAVRGYSPVSARFDSAKGPVYRLSLKGFASDRDARLLCESLRQSGGSCFVRNVAGDAPVQFAWR